MNWDAIGAVGEILGALAVVGPLVYLARQIHLQNAESRETSMHLVAEAFREATLVFGDSQMADILIKANNGVELTESELLQLYVGGTQLFRFWEEMYGLHVRGRIDAEQWEGMMMQLGASYQLPALRRVWTNRKAFYRKEFQELVDGIDEVSALEFR